MYVAYVMPHSEYCKIHTPSMYIHIQLLSVLGHISSLCCYIFISPTYVRPVVRMYQMY